MVVFAIIISITSVVLTSQNSFNKTLILANTAYDVALSIRSAETYGLGGRAIGTLPTGYGVHFDSGTKSSYLLFADTVPAASAGSACHFPGNTSGNLDAQPGDCVYTSSGPSGADVLVTTYTLGNGITINDLCTYAGSTKTCTNNSLISLDVVFTRPNADALMSSNGAYASSITKSCIELASQGGSRSVIVSASGQVFVSASACP